MITPPPIPPTKFHEDPILIGVGIVGSLLPQPPAKDARSEIILLNDIMYEGFTLVGVHIAADTMAEISLGPAWSAIPLRRICLSRAEAPTLTTPGTTAQIFVNTLPNTLARYSGQVLLLRPDMYVLAAFLPHDHGALQALDALIKATWTDLSGACENGGENGTEQIRTRAW